MKKLEKTIFSLLLTVIMCAGIVSPAFAASSDSLGSYDFTITNPYETVDWDNWKAYKAATHVHTKRSDGDIQPDEMIEKYYSLGFQALALTDHGTVNYSWHKSQKQLGIYYYNSMKPTVLSEDRYNQITTGSDRGGDGMTEIPLGIELNGMSLKKCHVNSYFVDCGHGDLEPASTWPEDAVKKSQEAGGICHINHVGEWTDGKDDINTYDEAFVTKFAKLFLNYSACIGMELVNTKDNRTHNDRYLYDETLKITAPQGRNVWGFCEDDAHDFGDVENNAQFFVMPENNAANIRTSMENGTFFACSKNAKTDYELRDGFAAEGEFPMISRVNVDNKTNQISINPYNATTVKMIADGNVIAEKAVNEDNETITFDLNDYEDQINSYVRIYVMGAGGICYAQPFLVTKTKNVKCTAHFEIPYENYTLTVRNGADELVEANADGDYTLTEAGEYSYTVTKSGYETLEDNFIVSPSAISTGQTINIEVELLKNSGPLTVDHSKMLVYGFDILTNITEAVNASFDVKAGKSISIENPSRPRTGDKIEIINNSTGAIEKTYTLVVFGDLDSDGLYDGQDATLASLIASGMYTPTEAQRLAADCNHDNVVDSEDVLLLEQAGVLLSSVSQGENLQTSSIFSEYSALISQDIPVDNEETPTDNEESPTENEPTLAFMKFIDNVVAFIKKIFAFFK